MITDYSSVMFDYSLLHRHMYFYAYDLDKYRDSIRGFYFNFLEDIPGPVSQNTDELIHDLHLTDVLFEEKYGERERLWYEKFHTYEHGNASDSIIKLFGDLSK